MCRDEISLLDVPKGGAVFQSGPNLTHQKQCLFPSIVTWEPNELLTRYLGQTKIDLRDLLLATQITEPAPMSMSPSEDDLSALRDSWGWILAMGICMAVAGFATIALPLLPAFATLTVVSVLGILLLVAGIAQIVSAFQCRAWKGVVLNNLVGILYVVTGFLVLENPVKGAVGLTLLLALFFLASGMFRIVISLQERFPGWGWTLMSGAVTVLLGLIIWRQLPESALWVVGLLLGIEFLFNGWMWIMLAFAFKRLGAEEEVGQISQV